MALYEKKEKKIAYMEIAQIKILLRTIAYYSVTDMFDILSSNLIA